MRKTHVVRVVATAVVASLAAVASASADVVILRNGDHLSGDLQAAELAVRTAQGVVQVAAKDIMSVTLDAATGDAAEFWTGRRLVGFVEQAAYTLRLPSGQTVALPRGSVSQVRFRPR